MAPTSEVQALSRPGLAAGRGDSLSNNPTQCDRVGIAYRITIGKATW